MLYKYDGLCGVEIKERIGGLTERYIMAGIMVTNGVHPNPWEVSSLGGLIPQQPNKALR
jgi:hypothetical protein